MNETQRVIVMMGAKSTAEKLARLNHSELMDNGMEKFEYGIEKYLELTNIALKSIYMIGKLDREAIKTDLTDYIFDHHTNQIDDYDRWVDIVINDIFDAIDNVEVYQ